MLVPSLFTGEKMEVSSPDAQSLRGVAEFQPGPGLSLVRYSTAFLPVFLHAH